VKVREIMTRPVTVVHTDTPVQEAAAMLTAHNITSMPVLDDDDQVVGIVSEADLIRERMPRHENDNTDHGEPAHLVSQVMTDTVVCLPDSADTADAAELMLNYDVRAIPIVSGSRLQGIVSRRDLLRSLVRDDDAIAAEVRSRLDYYAGRHGRWSVEVDDGVVTVAGQFDDEAERQVVSVLARTVAGVSSVHTDRHHRHHHVTTS
jgi:CBS domain-containing protein